MNEKADELLIQTTKGQEVIVDLRNKGYYDLVGYGDGKFCSVNGTAAIQKLQVVDYWKAFEPCGHFHHICNSYYKEIIIADAVF